MARFTGNGYLVDSLAALTAIPAVDRPAFKVLLEVAGVGWHEYDNAATSGGITPDDNPVAGRWFPLERETLRANRTYYVRTDGNDSNNGLADTSGGAFLTWAKAKAVLARLDGNGFSVTVKFTGTFTTPVTIDQQFIGFSFIQIDGDTTTPSNAFINVTGICISVSTFTPIRIRGIRFASTVAGIYVESGICEINGNVDFGAGSLFHIFVTGQKAQLYIKSAYIITGNAVSHIALYDQGFIDANQGSITVTLSGSRAFSQSFIIVGRNASGIFYNVTYSGSATGVRYIVEALCGLYVSSTTFPGSSAGTVDAKGYYGV